VTTKSIVPEASPSHAVRNLLRCEGQIVRTGLDRDRQTLATCTVESLERFTCCQMDDVYSRVMCASQFEEKIDGGFLRGGRT
jgi:hypothetical protein